MENLNYETLATSAKAAARDILRLQLVSARLNTIRNLEIRKTRLETEIQEKNLSLRVEEHELALKTEQEHPDLERITERVHNTIENIKSWIANLTKDLETINKEIEEQREGIAKIQSGETKVSYEAMTNIANELGANYIRENFYKSELASE